MAGGVIISASSTEDPAARVAAGPACSLAGAGAALRCSSAAAPRDVAAVEASDDAVDAARTGGSGDCRARTPAVDAPPVLADRDWARSSLLT